MPFDTLGHVTGVVDAMQNKTQFAYDHLYRVITITGADPDGDPEEGDDAPVVHYTWNLADQLLTTSDAMGRVVRNSYDLLGRLTSVMLPHPYAALDRLTKITGPGDRRQCAGDASGLQSRRRSHVIDRSDGKHDRVDVFPMRGEVGLATSGIVQLRHGFGTIRTARPPHPFLLRSPLEQVRSHLARHDAGATCESALGLRAGRRGHQRPWTSQCVEVRLRYRS